MTNRPVLVWFRNDLRIDDHPALRAAADSGAPVAALYVLDDALDGRPLGGAARWWLHHTLISLRDSLGGLGVPLILRRGAAADVVPALAAEAGAATVLWNQGATPFQRTADAAVAEALGRAGIAPRLTAPDLIADPAAVRTGSGRPYRVFTPFWRALSRDHAPARPVDAPAAVRGLDVPPPGDALTDWSLLPTHPDWAGGLRDTWQPGEEGAFARLETFLEDAVEGYAVHRNYPATEGTSRLSPHLRFGEISVRRLWHVAQAVGGDRAEPFLREVGWGEFNRHQLFQEPALHETPLRPEFAAFPWLEDHAGFRAWCEGRTGYPIVDAGMRQLWHTGWMHNRVRMITASFLVKDLLIPWQWGEKWFWDTLVDADAANNAGGWQWVAGCGSDAAPYFRVFNPTLQSEKFDPRGAYIRRWLPELSGASERTLHHPGPGALVDHTAARRRALAAYQEIAGAGT